MWSLAELATGIVFPSLLTLRPLLRQIYEQYCVISPFKQQSAVPRRADRTHVFSQIPSGASQRPGSAMGNDSTQSGCRTVITHGASQPKSDVIPLKAMHVGKDC